MPKVRKTKTEDRLGRKNRTPLHEQRDKMTVENTDPSKVYRWVNNVLDAQGNRVERFKLAGWTPVQNTGQIEQTVENGENKTSSVTEKHVGGRTKAILMEIDKDLYDEDQAAKQAAVDQSEADMRRDALNAFGDVHSPKLDIQRRK